MKRHGACERSLTVLLLATAVALGLSSCGSILGLLGGGSKKPPMPQDFRAETLSTTGIKLFWSISSTDVDYFDRERADGSDAPLVQLTTIGGTNRTYTDSGLVPGMTYRYRLRSANSEGFSIFTPEVTVSTMDVPVPQDFAAGTPQATQVTLTWSTTSTTIDTFGLERADGLEASFVLITSPGGDVRSYTDTGLLAGSRYRYRLRAMEESRYSAYTPELVVITPLAGSVPVVDVTSLGLQLNVGNLGDGMVDCVLSNLLVDYSVEIRVKPFEQPVSDWLRFDINTDGTADVSLPATLFLDGINRLEVRYVYVISEQYGAGTVLPPDRTIRKGAIHGTTAPGAGTIIDIQLSVAPSGQTVTDAVLQHMVRQDASTWDPMATFLLLPGDDGRIIVDDVIAECMLFLIGKFENYEYFNIVLARKGGYFKGNFDIRESTGAGFTGIVTIDDGSIHYNPSAATWDSDGKQLVTLIRQDDNQAFVTCTPDIPLDGSHPGYDQVTGRFTFRHLAGGVPYGLQHWWPAQRLGLVWWDDIFQVSTGAIYNMTDDDLGLWVNTALPIILVQHNSNSWLQWWENLGVATEASFNAGKYWKQSFDYRWLDSWQIMEVLKNASDPLHDRVALILADPLLLETHQGQNTLDPQVKEILSSLPDFADLGVERSNYVASAEVLDGTFRGLPFTGGATLSLVYRKSAHPEAPGLSFEDLVNPDNGYTLAFPEREAYWTMPWYHAEGGAHKYESANFNAAAFAAALGHVKSLTTIQTGSGAGDFFDGIADFYITGDWELQYLGEKLSTSPADLGIARLPYFADGRKPLPCSRTLNFYIYDTAHAQDLADILMDAFDAEFWAGKIAAADADWVPPFMAIPAYIGLDLTGKGNLKVLYDTLRWAVTHPYVIHTDPFWIAADQALVDFLDEKVDAPEAAQFVADQLALQ